MNKNVIVILGLVVAIAWGGFKYSENLESKNKLAKLAKDSCGSNNGVIHRIDCREYGYDFYNGWSSIEMERGAARYEENMRKLKESYGKMNEAIRSFPYQ